MILDGRDQPMYVGESDLVRQRLRQHLTCIQRFSSAARLRKVKFRQLPGASKAALKKAQADVIALYGLRAQGGSLTNKLQSEFEWT